MNLSDHLAALGVPAPSTTAAPVPAAAADVIMAACEPLWHASIHGHPSFDVFEMLDAYQALQLWSKRLEVELARYGSQVTHERPTPRVPKTVSGGGTWTKTDGFQPDPPRTVMADCDHALVDVDNELAEIVCRTCGESINAVWWLSRHCKAVVLAEDWRRATKEDHAKIVREIAELKDEKARLKQAIKRAKETGAKEWLRLDGAADMIPLPKRRKKKG